MNTTATTPTTRQPRRHVRRLLIRSAIAVAASALGVVGLAVPASAATQSGTVCFRHPNGSPYTYTTYAQQWNAAAQAWQNIGTDAGSVNGCERWNLPANQTIKFQAFYRVGRVCFIGNSPYAYVTPGSSWDFKVNRVDQVNC
ncbi:hypothetical protein [uncultured Friedmanniella sp.]|uniref:hypothetical protein n=1 Tax=uncultured Friedmanniella sp. TaxID=335381 RepID=UPI0035CBDC68